MTELARVSRLHLLGAALLLALASEAAAQPTGWSSQRYYNTFLGFTYAVRVFDLGTGGQIARFDAPPGVALGSGALTPDGRYYMVATNLGVARFTTSPPAFDRLLGPAFFATSLYMPPTGTNVHLIGQFGYAVLDWQTGDSRIVRCCVQPRLVFTPDGARRIEIETFTRIVTQTTVSVYDAATDVVQWSRTWDGTAAAVAASHARLAMSTAAETIVVDLANGEEAGRIRTGCRQCTGGPTPLSGSGSCRASPGRSGYPPTRCRHWPRPFSSSKPISQAASTRSRSTSRRMGASRIGCTGSRCSA